MANKTHQIVEFVPGKDETVGYPFEGTETQCRKWLDKHQAKQGSHPDKPRYMMQEIPEDEPEPVTTTDGMDEFLNDATLKVREYWEDRDGKKLGDHETTALNDLLTSFFSDIGSGKSIHRN